MKSKKSILIVLLVVACLAVGIYQVVADRGCTRPPKDFTEDDLIGTWYYGGPKRNDTLIIRNDGTYKQIVHIEHYEEPATDYKSDWQSWWVEYTGNGIPYLHLEGMRMCAHISYSKCDKAGGSGGAWWDFCEEETVYLPPGEGVLMVLGVPKRFEQPPRGIELAPFSLSIDFVASYEFIE
jgi:hypothetical protein